MDILEQTLRSFIAALKARNPQSLSVNHHVRYSENNVELKLGDGVWQTATSVSDPYLVIPDSDNHEMAFFYTIEETYDTSGAATRIKLDILDNIFEIETIIARQADEGFKFPNPQFHSKAIFDEVSKNSHSREEITRAANGYFDTLQRNDGTLHIGFHPECDRVENGVQTTRTPDEELGKRLHQATLGCAEQFKLGYYRYDDRLRDRRITVCNRERNIVVASGFIDHCGKVGDYLLSDGSQATSPIRRPHSYYLMEAFKVEEGMIRQVEAIFITVPYHMKSPWG
jgi:hypothetical protein